MPTMPAHSAGRSPSPSTKKSLFSRIKAPFGPKARHISDFYIQPDDPHRQYGPGDVITGSVVLKVVKPFSVTHIVVCLHGYAQVYKTPNSPGEGYRMYNATLAAGKTKKSGGYYGNGFVSLFEDEIVLCGEGRLGEGTYQFNFELVFPKSHMPSSIEFERGTVSYMITSTMTRPTTISPTTTCDRKMNFVEDIDIAPLAIPKPRIISLEPIPRRTRTKRVKRSTEKQPVDDTTPIDTSVVSNRVVEANGSQADSEPPHSPVPSDVSFDSCLSSGGTGSAIDSAAPSARTGECRSAAASHVHTHCSRRPITATVEIQKAGFLRGDTIPIKIGVAHTKQIKSLHGVIVTFYRQARVDMHPALPVVKGGDDDVYPKSRTGLSGLSLSSAGSTHLFRKDLSQSFASLIINPETLTAEIKAALRVPEEAFPSIASVPGAMISFKYYVEVVLDLQGKLSGLDRFLPNSGVSALSVASAPGSGRPGDASGTVFAAWGGHFINTEEIRRDKSVVSCVFEVVIGTRDSDRKSAWKQWPLTPEYDANDFTSQGDQGLSGGIANNQSHYSGATDGGHYFDYGHEVLSSDLHQPEHQHLRFYQQDVPQEAPPPAARFPMPDFVEEEQNLPEKERLRRAEARLLPSQPPEDGVESSASAGAHAPSAPVLPDPRLQGPSAPPASDLSAAGQTAPPAFAVDSVEEDAGPSAPAYHQHAPPPIAVPATDDKQELQRRRLESERSAPADMPDADGEVPLAPAPALVPSAPVLNEEDEFGFSFRASTHHPLPKYER